ncbi:hypothetical protein EDC01DRAFT_782362 [Geopyxis carbonaria]|nr:hypothetical protein EDC01DRAFT_782362 [Geopyxis carbonaria]
MKFKRRTGTVPVPLKTHQISKSEIHIPGPLLTPLTPQTERELRMSCSLLFAAPPPPHHSHHSHTKSHSSATRPPIDTTALPLPVSKDQKFLYTPSQGHSRVASNPRTPRHIEPSTLPRTPRANLPPKTPPSYSTDSTATSTAASSPAYAFAKTATARKVSISNALDLLPPPAPAGTRKPSLALSTDLPPPATTTGTGNRASQINVTLARPTLVTVSSPATSQRPKTSGTPRTPTADWSEFKKGYAGPGACGGERLSLFPRPRTAGGTRAGSPTSADRPLPPIPMPLSAKAGVKPVVSEMPSAKKSRFPGLAFWKGLRFGKKHHVQAGIQTVA